MTVADDQPRMGGRTSLAKVLQRQQDRDSPGRDPAPAATPGLPGDARSGSLARPAPPGPGAGRSVAIALIALGAALRLLYVFHHVVNTDEPQHLHVAWAWTQGLLPYRDVFDNHSPLFSMAMAPLLARVGERADVVVVMRLAMIPFAVAALVATWVIARRLFGATTAWWAVAMAMVFPDYVRASVEYRTDQMWAALWLWSLAAMVVGPPGVARSFASGLLMGIALSTSMKTVATGAGLAAAAIAVALVSSWRRPPGWIAPRFLAALAGGLAVPALLVAWFASHGALAPMREQTTSYNVVSGLGLWSAAPWRAWLIVPCLPLSAWVAGRIVRGAPEVATGRRRAVVLVAGALYWVLVETVWPLVTRQDYLPAYQIAALALAAAAVALGARAARGADAGRLAPIGVPAAIVVVLMALLLAWEPPWPDATGTQRATLGEVLRLTHPGERVMDRRGESIFRPRPSPLVMEEITLHRIATGRAADDIVARMSATATAVAPGDLEFFPANVQRFIASNYVPVGRWRAAGLRLVRANRRDGPRPVSLSIAGRYAAITAGGPARGTLDGSPIGPSRFLAAGPHEYVPAPGEGTVVLLWADAVERGFAPVAIREGRP
jgi:hypothetical protein